jgi:hypothetical protein
VTTQILESGRKALVRVNARLLLSGDQTGLLSYPPIFGVMIVVVPPEAGATAIPSVVQVR